MFGMVGHGTVLYSKAHTVAHSSHGTRARHGAHQRVVLSHVFVFEYCTRGDCLFYCFKSRKYSKSDVA